MFEINGTIDRKDITLLNNKKLGYCNMEHKTTNIGGLFLESLSEFYTWFMSCLKDPISHSGVFKSLSLLMRIATRSLEGGHYLTPSLEQKGIRVLFAIKEELLLGMRKQTEVLASLKKLIDDLTVQNIKAKLVLYLTELEYECCIYKKPSTQNQKFQEYLTQLNQLITPAFLEIKASAIVQILRRTLETQKKTHLDLEISIQQEINKWIGQENSLLHKSELF